MLEHFKGGIPGRSQAHLRRGFFTFHGQHVPGRDHGCTLRVGVQPSLRQEPFIYHTCPIPVPLFSPGPERQLNCHCQRGNAHCILATQGRATAAVSTGEVMLCPCQAFFQAVILVNWQRFPFWIGTSVFSLVLGGILQREGRGQGRARGIVLFLTGGTAQAGTLEAQVAT